ncbi:thiamine-phosphate kinase [Brachyspira pilosicoli]|mgnify:FL=1|uniref:thiamine-phosphate kinase n=1 Tax=Brachyspira pilosicoli TaxID=52584 RepID=UPI00249007DF|nr:thiamine-phosphate kinase [Brachyspira pilosicoli]
MKEFELIEKIKQLSNNFNKTSNINIGDDCAVLKNLSDKKDILVTTDILVENIHFCLKYYSFYDVGYKSAQVNISDIICKGAFPESVFVSLSIPKNITEENILQWYDGFLEACKPYNIEIAGGDTTSSNNNFFISITLIGEIEKNKAILRSTAKDNDNIYVLGIVGESDLGLKKLLSGNYSYDDESVKTHLRPQLFFNEWQEIIKKYKINSSIDISDGLLQDLSHIAEKSNLYAKVFEESNWQKVNRFFNNNNKEVLNSILTGGEDYAVLFTTEDNIEEKNNLIKIGKITSLNQENRVLFIDKNNKEVNFKYKGYNHN